MKQLFVAYQDGTGFLNVDGSEMKLNCFTDYVESASQATAQDWKRFMEAHSETFECAPAHFLRVPAFSLSEALEEPKPLWQPIATAPRDGTRILLHWRNCRPQYATSVGAWVDNGASSGFKCDEDLCVPKNQEDCILWTPIPELPPLDESQNPR